MAKKSVALSKAMQEEQRLLGEVVALADPKGRGEEVREMFVVKYALTSGAFRKRLALSVSEHVGKDGNRAVYASTTTGATSYIFVRVGTDAFFTEAAAREAVAKMYLKRATSLRKQLEQIQRKASAVATMSFPDQDAPKQG